MINEELHCIDCNGIYFSRCFCLYKNSMGDVIEEITEYKCLHYNSIYNINELKELKEK